MIVFVITVSASVPIYGFDSPSDVPILKLEDHQPYRCLVHSSMLYSSESITISMPSIYFYFGIVRMSHLTLKISYLRIHKVRS